MLVTMTQHPVGQGGMFSGKLDAGNSKFRWVYDCGTFSKHANLDREIEKVSEEGNLDILFLSHMDADHVNGVGKLLKECSVDTVVMPYLSIRSRFSIVTKYLVKKRGSIDKDYMEFLRNMKGYFSRRGVKRLIQVRHAEKDVDIRDIPDSDDGTVDVAVHHYGHIEEEIRQEIERLKDEERDHKFKAVIYWDEGELDLSVDIEDSSFEMINTSGDVKIEITYSSYDKVFLLIPHSCRPNKEDMEEFWEMAKDFFGSRRINMIFGTDNYKNSDYLNEVTNMFRCFKIKCIDILKTHNFISMSLYCGPMSKESKFVLKGNIRKRYFCNGGWILTGDSRLTEKMHLNEFLNRYKNYISNVRVLMVPHHGSKFDSDLVLYTKFSRWCICYAAAEYNRKKFAEGKGHPHKEVLQEVKNSGKSYRTVSVQNWSKITLVGRI